MSFYGGVPKAIGSDNLKSAVTRESKIRAGPFKSPPLRTLAIITTPCVINPTRSYSPQAKALVENAVQLSYQRIYYPLRQMTFLLFAGFEQGDTKATGRL